MMTLREIPYETSRLVFSKFISELHHEKLNESPFFYFIPTEHARMADERLLFVDSEIQSFIYCNTQNLSFLVINVGPL